MVKLGLALGGGGSRAMCHIGVIKALEKAGIFPDIIAGNSMGGIIGATYAYTRDISQTEKLLSSQFHGGGLFRPRSGDGLERKKGFLQHIKRNLRAFSIALVLSFRRGFLWKNPCVKAIKNILPESLTFEDLNIPLAIVALNATDGTLETFTSGNLQHPVIAGTNVGVVFPPYCWKGKEYFDAAPICSIPVTQAQELGADIVLAVDIRSPVPGNYRIYNGFDTIFRVEMIESRIINEQQFLQADFQIKPETGELFWGDFSTIDKVIKAGEDATGRILDRLKDKLNA